MIRPIWDKIKAICGRSLTIATGYVSMAGGELLSNIDDVASALHEPELSNQVQSLIGHDPKVAAVYAKVYGGLMIFTRLRSIFIKGKR